MLSERMRLTVDRWQLDEEQQLHLLLRWTLQSVRDAESILRRGEFSEQ